jgi:hypothetical protein
VLTIYPESFSAPGTQLIDMSLNKYLPVEIINHKIWSWEKKILIKFLKKCHNIYPFFSRVLEPKKKEWIFPAIKYLKNLDINKFDAVLSCSQPHANHLIGLHLKRKTRLPWIAFFSDPWVDNVYSEFRFKSVYLYHRALEEKVITCADKVLFTSPEMLNLVMKKFPEHYVKKCHDIPHSYVPEWYGDGKKIINNNKIKVLHTGHFYGPRTPMPFFRAMEKLNQSFGLFGKVEILFHGFMDNKYKKFIQKTGLSNIVKIKAAVSYHKSLKLMKSADYLLLIDAPLNKSPESVFLPSKLIDYLGSLKPVIGITPKNGASARVLEETGNIICDIESEAQIIDVFAKLLHSPTDVKYCKEKIKKYHYKVVGQRIKNIIEETVSCSG